MPAFGGWIFGKMHFGGRIGDVSGPYRGRIGAVSGPYRDRIGAVSGPKPLETCVAGKKHVSQEKNALDLDQFFRSCTVLNIVPQFFFRTIISHEVAWFMVLLLHGCLTVVRIFSFLPIPIESCRRQNLTCSELADLFCVFFLDLVVHVNFAGKRLCFSSWIPRICAIPVLVFVVQVLRAGQHLYLSTWISCLPKTVVCTTPRGLFGVPRVHFPGHEDLLS